MPWTICSPVTVESLNSCNAGTLCRLYFPIIKLLMETARTRNEATGETTLNPTFEYGGKISFYVNILLSFI